MDVIEVTAVPPIVTLAAVTADKFVPSIVIFPPTHADDTPPKSVIVGSAGTATLTFAKWQLFPVADVKRNPICKVELLDGMMIL